MFGALGLQVEDDALDPVLAFDAFVVEELECRHVPQAEPPPELPAQERHGALERPRRLFARLRVADRRVVDPRLLQVRGHLDVRERQKADPRIVHVAADELRQLLPQLVADTFGARALGHQPTGCATRSLTNTSITSPTLRSLYFSKPMPHSKPAL